MVSDFKCGKCGTTVEATSPSCPVCAFVFGAAPALAPPPPVVGLSHPVTRWIGYVALAAAALCFSVTRLGFPRVGFEGALVWGGLAAWISLLAAAVAITTSVVLKLKSRSVGWGPSVLSLIAAVIVLSAPLLPG